MVKNMRGNCYVLSEALYRTLTINGDYSWKPMHMKHEGESHWFLQNKENGAILDLTVGQFMTKPDYSKARGKGFLSGHSTSKKAAKLMYTMLWQK